MSEDWNWFDDLPSEAQDEWNRLDAMAETVDLIIRHRLVVRPASGKRWVAARYRAADLNGTRISTMGSTYAEGDTIQEAVYKAARKVEAWKH